MITIALPQNIRPQKIVWWRCALATVTPCPRHYALQIMAQWYRAPQHCAPQLLLILNLAIQLQTWTFNKLAGTWQTALCLLSSPTSLSVMSWFCQKDSLSLATLFLSFKVKQLLESSFSKMITSIWSDLVIVKSFQRFFSKTMKLGVVEMTTDFTTPNFFSYMWFVVLPSVLKVVNCASYWCTPADFVSH